MRRSVQSRHLLFTAGIAVFSLAALSLLFSMLCYTYVIGDKRKTVDTTAEAVADVAAAVGDISGLNNWEISLQAASISRATGLHIFLADEGGRVVVCSDSIMSCEHIGDYLSADILSGIGETERYRRLTDLSGFYGEKRFVGAMPVSGSGGTTIGYVFVSAELGSARQLWRGITFMMLLTAAFVLIIIIPISVYSSRRETRPLKELATAARQFAKGDLSVRVSPQAHTDEVGELCEAFNQMADALESSETRRREFISSVSHELKTPMTTISGYADGLLDGTIPMDSAEKYLSVISSETKRLSRLVRQMLDISRMKEKTETVTSVFDASEMLRQSIISLYSKIEEKGLALRPEIPETPIIVRGSSDDVSRVVYNILDNAIKFADAGTPLDISLFKQEGKAYISITDRGETIPEEELPVIFDRFHKSDRSRSLDKDGVGLGLYIVKTILDQMGEDVWVRSRDGETEFRFSLTVAA